MINKFEGIFNDYQKQVSIAVIFSAALLLLSLLIFNYKVIIAPYPHEYREGAIVLTTQQMLDGINPYLLEEQPQHSNVYGALYHLIAYPLASVFGSTLTLHRAISAFFIVLTCLWLMYVMKKEGVPGWLTAIGGALYYSQITSLFSVIARPDSLGVFLFLCAVFIPWIGNFKLRYLALSSLFFILSFYTKLYFVISLPIVALYIFLFKDKARAVFYLTTSILFLVLSAFIANIFFPLYLTNTFYYYLNVGNSFFAGLWHVARQTAYFSFNNFGLVFIFLALLWEHVYINKAEFIVKIKNYSKAIWMSLKTIRAAKSDFDYILYVFLMTSAAFVFKLGHNTGGFVDYIYHLITPFMIIIIFRFLSQKIIKKEFASYGILLIAGIVFAFFNHRQAADYSSQWLAIENKLSGYEEIFNEPAITSVLVKQKKYVYDSGHSNAYLGNGMGKSPLYPKIRERMKAYENIVNDKIIRQEFDLVVMDNYSYNMITRDMLADYYEPTSKKDAPMILGGWILEFWEPKPDSKGKRL